MKEKRILAVNRLALSLLMVLLAACSGESGISATEEKGEHVWKTQTDALEKARQVEGLLDEAASRQLRANE